MKKNILIIITIFSILLSCKEKTSPNHSDSLKAKKLSKRDYSITKENAYNDIFLDSSAVDDYIKNNKLSDSTSRRIRSFYNTRNYEFAWFSSDGLSEQAMGFTSLKKFSGDTSAKQKKLKKIMDDFMGDSSLIGTSTNKSIVNTELLLTENLINFSLSNFEKGYLKRKELERFIPFKKTDPIVLADSLLNKKHKDDKYFSDIDEPYKLLAEELRKYVAIAKNGSWPKIEGNPKDFKEGKSSAQISSMKKMLMLTGDMQQADSNGLFDENLKNGIKIFQTRFGFTPDGKMTASVLAEMELPAIERIKQILINMNRMRWMPQKPSGKLIVVNIPAFMLNVYDGKNKVFSMPVVVGKEGHNTTLFSDLLTTIVFSPYWNVPPSIVKTEIVPGMKKNTNYLEDHDMEITGTENGLPVVRQKPGPKNSLGEVKFLFPNVFNIYFHDTPAKSLFNKDVRAYSHGCIRLSDPLKLADYLLKDNPIWTSEKIDSAMNSGKEQFVSVKDPIRVFITYYTAWVDENNLLNFRNDIYGHDKNVANKMF
ncbi:MAG: L,D-transpeptidase family protein [Bacteroidota bacterium]|nr:L,D-transpeptidase family protein [Bacteroidota bacterium]